MCKMQNNGVALYVQVYRILQWEEHALGDNLKWKFLGPTPRESEEGQGAEFTATPSGDTDLSGLSPCIEKHFKRLERWLGG